MLYNDSRISPIFPDPLTPSRKAEIWKKKNHRKFFPIYIIRLKIACSNAFEKKIENLLIEREYFSLSYFRFWYRFLAKDSNENFNQL